MGIENKFETVGGIKRPKLVRPLIQIVGGLSLQLRCLLEGLFDLAQR